MDSRERSTVRSAFLLAGSILFITFSAGSVVGASAMRMRGADGHGHRHGGPHRRAHIERTMMIEDGHLVEMKAERAWGPERVELDRAQREEIARMHAEAAAAMREMLMEQARARREEGRGWR